MTRQFFRLVRPSVILLLAAASGFAACGSGNGARPTSPSSAGNWSLSGRVTGSSVSGQVAGVTGAKIEILDGANAGKSATANAEGLYRIDNLTEGGFSVRISAPGWEPVTHSVTLTSNATLDAVLSPRMVSVTGRAMNALTGAGLGGITIRVDQVGEAITNGNGDFLLSGEVPDGRFRLTASGPGIVERQTWLAFPGGHTDLYLIPASFDLGGFDTLVRRVNLPTVGEPSKLTRWSHPPALIVETSVLEDLHSESGVSHFVMTSTGNEVNAALVQGAIDRMSEVLPSLTGGNFQAFASITSERTPAGGSVSTRRTGAVVLSFARVFISERGEIGGLGGSSPEPFEVTAGRVWINPFLLTTPTSSGFRYVVAHEFGHALGYYHTTARSVMSTAGDLTDFDRSATTIAFRRPPGNRAPDIDPDSYTVNQTTGTLSAVKRFNP